MTESLAGRAGVLQLSTLSYAEVHQALPETSVEDMVVGGGFPELYEKPELDARGFFRSYVATYLERDLRAQLQVGSLRDFERFLRAAALRTAGLLNRAELARDVGISPSTAGQWLSVLERSGVVTLLEPWFSNPHEVAGQDPEAPFSGHRPVRVSDGDRQPRRLVGLAACRRAVGVAGMRGAAAIGRERCCALAARLLEGPQQGGRLPLAPRGPLPPGRRQVERASRGTWQAGPGAPRIRPLPSRAPSSAARPTATRLRRASRRSRWPISRPSSGMPSREIPGLRSRDHGLAPSSRGTIKPNGKEEDAPWVCQEKLMPIGWMEQPG